MGQVKPLMAGSQNVRANRPCGDFDWVLHLKVTGKMVSDYDVNFLGFWKFLQNWLKYRKIPHMEVLDIVIRNLPTHFGDHSSQTPLAPGIFMCFNIAKRNTYISVHTYAIKSHLLLKQRQNNKLHDGISFQTIRYTCKKKKEQKRTQILSNAEAL